ncbi:MAG: PAS domain S-box protein, partial [Deltaproteobacteria bacterium]|nr:PAS domain S-box protein [Deltaproteobacteria bacterium]
AATLVLALLVVFRMGTPGEGAALVFLFPPLAWIAFAYGIALTSLALLLTVAATLAAAATGCLDLSPSTFQALALVVITASALYFAGLVTLQRRAESNRAVQEESYRLLLEAAFAGFVLHQNRLIVQVNERLCGMLDRTGSELLGRDILDVISPKDQARVQGFIGSGYEGIYEVDFLRRDGSTLPVEICGRPLRAGDRVMRMAAVRDISRRRATEDALRESEERYRTLLELAPDGVLVLDMEGTVVSANRRAGEILAYAEEELTGLALGDLVHPDEAPGLPAALGALHGEEPVTFQHRLLKKNTMHIHGELSVRRFGSDRIQVILRDVSERHRVQEALRESEERYRELFRNLLSGFALHELVLDASGHPVDYVFLEANAAFEELTGLRAARVLGRRVTEVIPGIEQSGEGWIETYARVALTGESVRFEQYSGALDRWYLVQAYSPRKRFFVTLFHDITEVKRAEAERRDMEARIQHAQKLESLGVLAGGIAHDFNNLLVGVLANAAMARDRLDQPPVAVAFLDQIERSARRAADLTAQMLAYSGRGQFQVARVNLSELVREMADLLHTVLSKKAILQLELDPELPAVLADVTQVRQVVMNLLTNASDALRDGHGEITVRTGVRTLGSGDAESPPATDDTLQGTFVLLEVHDTGCGMDAETRRRMF